MRSEIKYYNYYSTESKFGPFTPETGKLNDKYIKVMIFAEEIVWLISLSVPHVEVSIAVKEVNPAVMVWVIAIRTV